MLIWRDSSKELSPMKDAWFQKNRVNKTVSQLFTLFVIFSRNGKKIVFTPFHLMAKKIAFP